MLEKVVEIILEKFLQPRTRKQKADDFVKEKLVFLHECLVNCHNAYLRFVAKRNDENLENWKKAVRDLAVVLDQVGLALSSHAPETFDSVAGYFGGELPIMVPFDFSADDEEFKKIARRLPLLSNQPVGHYDDDYEHYDDDYKEATTRLREFMKKHMTVGEILEAQENFRRDTYWKYSW